MPNRFVDLKRIRIQDACYFVTSKTFRNFPYFGEPIFCDLFVKNLRLCKRIKEFELYGWFLGYDHFHLAIRPMGKWNCSEIMHSLKRNVSRDINKMIQIPAPSVGEDPHPRLDMKCISTQIGKSIAPITEHAPTIIHGGEHGDVRLRGDGTMNRLKIAIIRAQISFSFKYDHRNAFPKFDWQKSFLDHYCRDERDFRNHLEYIAHNPVKHHLPMDWPYIFTNPKFADLVDDCGLS